MKKNLKYFENELNRINKEFAEYKKQHMEKPEIGKTVEIAGMDDFGQDRKRIFCRFEWIRWKRKSI